jgi:hypothetical protein
MNGDQYTLSFDLSAINRQIAELQNSYTSLTGSFKKSADESEGQLKRIEENVKTISSSLDASFTRMEKFYTGLLGNLKVTTEYFEKLEAHSKSVTDNLTKLGNVDLSKLKQGAVDDTAEKRIAALKPDTGEGDSRFRMSMEITAASDKAAEVALKKAEGAIKAAQKALAESKETSSKITEVLKKEASGAKQKMKGIASGATGGVIGGGILTGLIGMMIMGVKEKQRMGAERGEMLNVFEAIGDSFSKESKRAVGWFSRFAEKAQWYFGIGRKEVQATVKQLVDAGYKSDKILGDYNKRVTDVEANVVTMTIGIDKHLNQATGTSMQNVVKLVENYGDSLDEASDKYKRLAFEAQRSGMGVNKFIDAIMSGSSALTQYGIEMEDVVEIMGKMQDYYEDMGLDKQFAGGQAAQAVKGIVGGIAGLDQGTMAALAQRMFGSLGLNALEAIQMFKEGSRRVAEGKDKDFAIAAAQGLKEMAIEATGRGDRAAGILFLESRGMENQHATALYDVADKLEKGTRIEELSTKEQKVFNDAFKTEGKQLTELQKTQRSLISGLADIGQGLIKILAGLVGAVAVGFKNILRGIEAAVLFWKDPQKSSDLFAQIGKDMETQLSGVKSGGELILQGAEKTGSALGGALGDVGKQLKEAVTGDPGGRWAAMGEAIKSTAEGLGALIEDEGNARELMARELKASFNKRIAELSEFIGFTGEEDTKDVYRHEEAKSSAAADRLREESERKGARAGQGFARVKSSKLARESRNPKFKLKARDLDKGATKFKEGIVQP